MTKMRSFLSLIFLVFSFISFTNLFAVDGIKLLIENIEVKKGDDIVIPVKATNFKKIIAGQVYLKYDQETLKYTKYVSENDFIKNGIINVNEDTGIINIVWNIMQGASIPAGKNLLDLEFEVIGDKGISSIKFNPQNLESILVDEVGNSIEDCFEAKMLEAEGDDPDGNQGDTTPSPPVGDDPVTGDGGDDPDGGNTGNNNPPSSGGSSGGSSSSSIEEDSYSMPKTESDKLLELNKSIEFDKSEGVFTSPVQLSNKTNKYQLNFAKDTKVTYEDDKKFLGEIRVPLSISKNQAPKYDDLGVFVRALKLGDEKGKLLKLSKAVKIKIAVEFSKKITAEKVKVYSYDQTKKKYQVIEDGKLADDQKSISLALDNLPTDLYVFYNKDAKEESEVVLDDKKGDDDKDDTNDDKKDEDNKKNDNETEEIKILFKDINKHWAKECIIALTEKGILKNQRRFRPKDSVKRVELVKIIVEAFEIPFKDEDESDISFSDVSSDKWYYRYIVALGDIIKGFSDGTFRPNKYLNRAEALKFIVEARDDFEEDLIEYREIFKDVPERKWFSKHVVYAVDEGIIDEDEDYFYPQKEINRGELAQMMCGVVLDEEE